MTNNLFRNRIGRRELMQGSAGLMGMTLLPGRICQSFFKETDHSSPQMHFWNGSGFVPADRVSGDASISSVRIVVTGFGSGPICALDLQTNHLNDNGQPLRFCAWTAPPRGHRRVSFVAGADDAKVQLIVYSKRNNTQDEYALALQKNDDGCPLREGTYLLTPTKINSSFLALVSDEQGARIESVLNLPLPDQHLLIDVRRA